MYYLCKDSFFCSICALLRKKEKVEERKEEVEEESKGSEGEGEKYKGKEGSLLSTAGLCAPSNNGLEKSDGRVGKHPLVIFFNGTFAPIHKGHINTICDAKRLLEEKVGNFKEQ